MSEFFSHPAILIVIGLIPGAVLGFLGHRRSTVVDKVTDRAQTTTNQIGSVNQVIEAMDKHNTNLQEDNRLLRESQKILLDRVETCRIEVGELRNTQVKLEQRQAELVEEVRILTKALGKDMRDNPRLT